MRVKRFEEEVHSVTDFKEYPTGINFLSFFAKENIFHWNLKGTKKTGSLTGFFCAVFMVAFPIC